MRYLRYAFLGMLVAVLVILALANREMVILRLLPQEMAGFLGFSWQIELPLFLVIVLGIAVGVIIGFVWEWLREHKHRAEARAERRERERLEREVDRARTGPVGERDEILALLEPARR